MKDRVSSYEFDKELSRMHFGGTGFFGGGATSDQKKEYIKLVFDDTMERMSDGRRDITEEEWKERETFLRQNKRDILSDQDIDLLAQKMKRYFE